MFGRMEEDMMVNGKMGSNKAKENLWAKMEKLKLEFGKMEKE